MTGLWQLLADSDTTLDDMIRLDLQYIKQQSLWFDLKLILQTSLIVINELDGKTVCRLWLSLFSERAREEWFGDLREFQGQWQEQGLSRWIINVRIGGVELYGSFWLSSAVCSTIVSLLDIGGNHFRGEQRNTAGWRKCFNWT